MKKYINNFIICIVFILIILVRIVFILTLELPVDSDEAVFGLMTKYIFDGKDYPIFVWKAHYVGTVSCYISALLWKIFGVSNYILRYTMIIWEIVGIIFFSLLFNKDIFLLILLSFVFVPMRVMYYTSSALYYGELFTLGMIPFFLLKTFIEKENKNKFLYFVFGFVNGFGIYHQPLYIPYFLTSMILFFKHKLWKNKYFRILIELGFLLGLLPLVVYNIQNPLATFRRLGGRLILSSSIENKVSFLNFVGYVFNAIEYLYGSSFVIYFLLFIVVFFICKKNKFVKTLFFLLFIISFMYFLATFNCVVVRGRYLLPTFYATTGLLALFYTELYKKNKLIVYFAVLTIIVVNSLNFSSVFKLPTSNFLDLVCFLQKEKIQYAYSDYWTAYPVVFLSKEKIVVSPIIADVKGFHDRTPQYKEMVSKCYRKCYIFSSALEKDRIKLVDKLKNLKINFEQKKLKDKFNIIVFDYKDDDTILLR